MTSIATLDVTGFTLRLDRRAALLGLSRRTVHVPTSEIVSTRNITAGEARRLLRWRVAGAAVPGWWLMGWFSRTTRDGRWAWVWMTPRRDLLAVETTRRRLSLVVVPTDWLVNGGAAAPTST